VTALSTTERARRQEAWHHRPFTLTSGLKAIKGGRAVITLGVGTAAPATATTNVFAIGVFDETVDATAGAKPVSVDLEREVKIEWFINSTAGGDAIAATDVGGIGWMADDQTVGILAAGRAQAGRIWAVDAVKGVAIEKLSLAKPVLSQPAAGAFVANDYAPATLENDSLYDIPATAGVSTVTLPAAAADGTRVQFSADGVKNAHTVQYRDATGPTVLTTALVASKRHLVIATKLGGKWVANAYTAP
jgi:hypothetical protein